MIRTVLPAFCLAVTLSGIAYAQNPEVPETVEDTARLLLERLEQTGVFETIRLRPDLGIEASSQGEVEQTFFPDNLHRVLSGLDDPADVAAALDDHVATMLAATGDEAPTLSEATLDRVYPVVRHAGFASGTAELKGLLHRPFVGDMAVLYVLDSPRSAQYLSRDNLADADLSEDEIRAAASANLSRLSRQVQVDGGAVSLLVLDGYYESSLLLDETLWQVIASGMPNLVAIVPARDIVAFGDASDPQIAPFLQEQAGQILSEAPGPISSQLLRWTDEGWVVE